MPIDFPTSPVTNQQYTYAGKTYVFSAQGTWVPTGGGAYTASSTAPTSPTPGDHWYDLSTGVLSIWINDGTSSQWVMVSPGGGSGSVGSPQGRLTLQTATPVMTTTQSAKTTIYYTPYVGNRVPIYDGTNMVMTTFSELSVATTDTTKSPAAIGASKVNDWFVWSDAGTIRLGHGPDWTSDTARSAGTALVMTNGIWTNNAAITNGPAAQRGTYVGTTRSNASSQLDWNLGGSASGGIVGWLGVWNAYNRLRAVAKSIDDGAQYTYSSITIRQARASVANQISFVVGLVEEALDAIYTAQIGTVAVPGAYCYFGVGFDSITVFSTRGYVSTSGSGAGQGAGGSVIYSSSNHTIGWHYVAALEGSDGANGNSFGSPAGFNSFNLTVFA